MYRPRPVPPRRLARQNWRNTRGATLGRDALALVADGHRDRVELLASPPTSARLAPRSSRYQPRAGRRSPPGCRGSGRSCRRPARSPAGSPATSSRNRSSASPAATRPAMIFRARVGQVDQLPVHLHPARLDPGHVEQLGDQPGHPVGVGVDRLQHHPLLVVGEPGPLGQQRGGEALHAGQRGAQLVGDGGDELGAAAFEPVPLLRAAQADRRAAGWTGGRPPGPPSGPAQPSPARTPRARARSRRMTSISVPSARYSDALRVPGAGGRPSYGSAYDPPVPARRRRWSGSTSNIELADDLGRIAVRSAGRRPG